MIINCKQETFPGRNMSVAIFFQGLCRHPSVVLQYGTREASPWSLAAWESGMMHLKPLNMNLELISCTKLKKVGMNSYWEYILRTWGTIDNCFLQGEAGSQAVSQQKENKQTGNSCTFIFILEYFKPLNAIKFLSQLWFHCHWDTPRWHYHWCNVWTSKCSLSFILPWPLNRSASSVNLLTMCVSVSWASVRLDCQRASCSGAGQLQLKVNYMSLASATRRGVNPSTTNSTVNST